MFGWTCGRAESDGGPATRRRVPVQGHSGRRIRFVLGISARKSMSPAT